MMPEGWAVVHAAKEPFHRMALGYENVAVQKNILDICGQKGQVTGLR